MAQISTGPFNLEYFEAGKGNRVIILVHGASSSARIWHTVQEHLAKDGIRSIALSLLGAGGSERSQNEEDYHPESYAAQLAGAVDAFGVSTFTLIGHSLGTIVAAYYVRDHADRVESLVQMSGPPVIGEVPQQPQPGERPRIRYPDAPDHARWEQQHLGLPSDVREALRNDINSNPTQRMPGQRPPWKGIDEVAKTMTVPTLVICGDADDVVHPQFPVQYYLSLPHEVRHLHVFHGVGHYPNAQVPDRLAGVLSRFVGEKVTTS